MSEEITNNMVWVDAIKWQSGSNKMEKSFWLDRFEVTQKEYFAVMVNNPSFFKGENHPVEKVTWYEAIMFMRKPVSDCRRKGNGIKRYVLETYHRFSGRMKPPILIPGIKELQIKKLIQ